MRKQYYILYKTKKNIQHTTCLIPSGNGVLYEGSNTFREMLWDNYYTSGPEQQRQLVERSVIVKRA